MIVRVVARTMRRVVGVGLSWSGVSVHLIVGVLSVRIAVAVRLAVIYARVRVVARATIHLMAASAVAETPETRSIHDELI